MDDFDHGGVMSEGELRLKWNSNGKNSVYDKKKRIMSQE